MIRVHAELKQGSELNLQRYWRQSIETQDNIHPETDRIAMLYKQYNTKLIISHAVLIERQCCKQ